jgi:trigger factor
VPSGVRVQIPPSLLLHSENRAEQEKSLPSKRTKSAPAGSADHERIKALNVKTQNLENRQVEMTVEVPEERLQAAMRSAARRLAQNVKIPGFRPGKAPYEVILNKVGHESIFEEALDGLGQEMYREAIKESDLNPYAPGTLEEIVSKDPLVLRFTVPLEPNVELGDYREIRVPFESPEVSDEEFEKVLEEIRQSRALIEPADRPAQFSDVVIIDVTSELKEPEEGEDASIMDMKGTEILLSEDARWPIKGIAEHLVGIEAGKELDFDATFPEDYPVESLRQREAKFHIKCVEVKSRLIPEWSDDLAQSMGEFNDLLDLRLKLRDNLIHSAQQEADSNYTEEVMAALVDKAGFEYPPILLEEGIDELVTEWSKSLASQNMTLDDYLKIEGKKLDDLREELLPQAQKRLLKALVLGKIVEEENLKVDEQEITEQIERIVEPFKERAGEFRKVIDNPEGRRRIRLDLLTEKAFQRIITIAKGEGDKIESKEEMESEEKPSETEETSEKE